MLLPYFHVFGVRMTNNGFWIGWLDLLTPSLQLLLITMNYNSSQLMTAEDSLHSLPDYECLLFHCDWLGSDLRITHFWFTNELWMTSHLRINPEWINSESESYVTTDGQSASLSWHKAPIWGLRPDLYYLCDSFGFVVMERSLWREDGSVVYNRCWSSPVPSFSCPSPVGLAAIFYCLRF
jgi:hypothetical protein